MDYIFVFFAGFIVGCVLAGAIAWKHFKAAIVGKISSKIESVAK